tara:strand:+ start:250 stop:648 length:399 start_codon:yes stop_codon:yes gene_type:complete
MTVRYANKTYEFEYSPTWEYHPIVVDGATYDFDPGIEVPVPEDHEDYGKTVQQIIGSDIITDSMITEHRELDTWEQIRQHRNKLLIECDWTQGADVPSNIKDPWATYRTALRDITTAATTADVVWPTKPGDS